MRIVLQRVASASVTVDGSVAGEIGPGLLVLVGISDGDNKDVAVQIARKCAEMRVFSDAEGKFNLSLLDTGGEALVVSQFTLLADVRRGRRPSFAGAARPEVAEPLVEAFAGALRDLGVAVETGVFGAKMEVALVNDGPVTIVLDSADMDRPRRRG
jgi:D-tyrosyl-tRNA(Tyr) deacylase